MKSCMKSWFGETYPRVLAACCDVFLLTLWVLFHHDAWRRSWALTEFRFIYSCSGKAEFGYGLSSAGYEECRYGAGI